MLSPEIGMRRWLLFLLSWEEPGNTFLTSGRSVGTQAATRITPFSVPAHLE